MTLISGHPTRERSDSSAYITETPWSLDTAIGRVDGLQDQATVAAGSAGTMEAAYTYLGLGTLVQQKDGNSTELSYIQQSPAPTPTPTTIDSGGDRYTGLDRFGRVVYQNWFNTSTGAQTQGDQYGYDSDSNVLYDNVVGQGSTAASYSQLYHASSTSAGDNNSGYNPLNRETTFFQGTLSASGNKANSDAPLDTVANASINTAAGSDQTYTLDALGNRTSHGSAAGTGTSTAPTLTSSTNAFNGQNEFTTSGGSSVTYNNNGDLTANGTGGTNTYDAWDDLISACSCAGFNPYVYDSDSFAYDAEGRQISDDGYCCTASFGSSSSAYGCCCCTVEDVTSDDPAEYYDDLGQVVQDTGSYDDSVQNSCDVTCCFTCGCCCYSCTTCYYSDVATSGCTTDNYAWGTDYVNDLVLRDTTGTATTTDASYVNGTLVSSSTSSTTLTPQRIYPQHDANLNIKTLTNTSGAVLEHIDYDPWGNATVLTSAYATTGTAFGSDSYNWIYGFQGGRLDVGSGLYHFGARNYNPATGTWMEQDPDGYINGSDVYQAFASAPRVMADPAGTWVIDRTNGSTAEAISQTGDTIAGLAARTLLNPAEWRKWLTLPTASSQIPAGLDVNTPLDFLISFGVPNLFVQDFGDSYDWGSGGAILLGFKVLKLTGATNAQIIYHLNGYTQRKLLYGYQFYGHGDAGAINTASAAGGTGVLPMRYTFYGLAYMNLNCCLGLAPQGFGYPYVNASGATVSMASMSLGNTPWRYNVSPAGSLNGYEISPTIFSSNSTVNYAGLVPPPNMGPLYYGSKPF